MVNIVPMAGLGTRFSKEGYTLPKPLIPVSGVPMIIRVIRNMPKSNKWIFILRKEHIDQYHIDQLIKEEVNGAIIIPVEETTKGQACSCMLAEPYLNPEEDILIAACDNAYLYNKEEYEILCKEADCVVWTFSKRDVLRKNPNEYGWVKLDGSIIKDVSVKKQVSNDPYNDHAIVATFYFKRAKDFIDSVNLMIKNDYKINGEFFIDAVPIFLNKLGKKSTIFDVDLYVGWGKPSDLYEYQKWEYFCKNNIKPGKMSKEEERLYPLWRKYFKNEK